MTPSQPASATGRRQALLPLLAVLAVGLLVMVWELSPPGDILERFELRTIDARFLIRGSRPHGTDILIVCVDDQSLDRVGPWPWPRERHARLVRALQESGARRTCTQ